MILIDKQEIFELIEFSKNSDADKALFTEIAKTSMPVSAVSFLRIEFDNGESIMLDTVTMKNLFFHDINKKT